MVQTSTHEVVIDVPKLALITMASNPVFISGLLGHVSILEAYDPKQDRFVSPEELTAAPTKFKVAYVFGTSESKVSMQLGEMEGPTTYVDTITYKGFTYDNKMKWEITFTLKELSPSKTRVTIVNRTEVEEGLFDRFLGRDHFDLADHVVREHIIPFIKLYINHSASLRESVVQGLVNYKTLAEEEGTVKDVTAKLMRLARESKAEHTMITIQGDNYRGKIVLKDGKPVDVSIKYADGSTKTGDDALAEALASTAKGKMTLYSVDADNLVSNAFEEIYSEETAKAEEKNQT